jgi:SAM-dependent methyltransferase
MPAVRRAVDSGARTFGPLGDTPQRDYSLKLRLFNAFAEPELRAAIASLGLAAGMRVLDAGCGTGESLAWLAAAVAPGGFAVGADLSAAHVGTARRTLHPEALLLQADVQQPPIGNRSLDLVWSVNTVHHLRDPLASARALAALLREGGRLVLGQSSLLPDMYFAWDARLERVTTEAVRAYYRDRYGVSEHQLTALRALVGLMRKAGLADVSARTWLIERVAPLDPSSQAWLLEAIFRGTWGERLRPYLAPADYRELMELCDPQHSRYALARPDFHFLQTFTLVVGSA